MLAVRPPEGGQGNALALARPRGQASLLKQSGLGRKHAPFVYWIQCNEERWALNPRQDTDMPYWDEREKLKRINLIMRKSRAIRGVD